MRVLMLGWEFPPYISGGLGTACHGLTHGLSRQSIDVLFVLPRHVDPSQTAHLKLLSPASAESNEAQHAPPSGSPNAPNDPPDVATSTSPKPHSVSGPRDVSTSPGAAPPGVTTRSLPLGFVSPYIPAVPRTVEERIARGDPVVTTGEPSHWRPIEPTNAASISDPGALKEAGLPGGSAAPVAPNEPRPNDDYRGDIIEQAKRYADLCVDLTRGESFDVIHAHDWMTWPAGLAVARVTGKPMVAHVHSTEYDRSGEHGMPVIYDIERRGMHGAIDVICVSQLTRNVCAKRYGVAPEKLHVVYNGIEMQDPATEPAEPIRRGDKIVLFLGRLTMQKGPEYFVEAAAKVLSKLDRVKFVMAGSGDMAPRVMSMARDMGIAHKVLFTGFLRGKDVERVFDLADVYVMPSVSEPFGIAPLEAIRHDVPVIISRSSGVAEVVQHALKVDFWDTEDIANKIIAVLRHAPLSRTLRQHADMEVRGLTWDGAAIQCLKVYHHATESMRRLQR